MTIVHDAEQAPPFFYKYLVQKHLSHILDLPFPSNYSIVSKYYHDLDGTVTQILREYGSLTDLLKNRVHRISLFSSSSSSNIMTIKHIEETSRVFVISSDRIGITELGDNKVMKQTVDDAFIDVTFNFGFHDIGLYEERCEAQLSVRLLDLWNSYYLVWYR